MRKIREILRLHFEQKLGQWQIARSASVSQSTVHEYLARFQAAGIGWPLGEEGRKLFAGTALYGRGGELLAVARQVWIAPR